MRRLGSFGCLTVAALVLGSVPLRAQTLPSGPVTFADGNVTIGGDASVTFGPVDPGYFNYTDYDRSALRLLQLDVTGSAKAGRHLTVLGQVRSQNANAPNVFALYVRIHPWENRRFDIQVGRVPPTFGAFSRRAYGPDNLLIGYPLVYQYLTSLRPDALPANADELLRMRGRGWLSSYTVGNIKPARGMPLVNAFRWDTGVQVHAANDFVELAAALTAGTVSNPIPDLSEGLQQIVGRVAVRPAVGLVVGASAAHGPFLMAQALDSVSSSPGSGKFAQNTWGADVEYSRDYYLVRLEITGSRWTMPAMNAPLLRDPLRSLGTSVEGRYKIRPDAYLAARFDHLDFSEIAGSTLSAPWEAPVTRVEIGGGYLLQRNLQLKLSFQHNARDTTRASRFNIGAAQVMFWF